MGGGREKECLANNWFPYRLTKNSEFMNLGKIRPTNVGGFFIFRQSAVTVAIIFPVNTVQENKSTPDVS
jgi:hypothetical protein